MRTGQMDAAPPRAGRRWVAALALALAMAFVQPAAAAAAPDLDVQATWAPTNLPPGGKGQLIWQVRNFGDVATDGPVTVTATLPPGVKRIPPTALDKTSKPRLFEGYGWTCSGTATVSCTTSAPVSFAPILARGVPYGGSTLHQTGDSGFASWIFITVAIEAGAGGTHPNLTTVAGGGMTGSFTDANEITIASDPAGFGLTPGTLAADVFDEQYPSGVPERQAATAPFELRIDFDLNRVLAERPPPAAFMSPQLKPSADDNARTLETTLPLGLIGNPEATPKCIATNFVEASGFLTHTKCAPETQVGMMNLELNTAYADGIFAPGTFSRVPVYNLVPPKGVPADFGFTVGPYKGHIYPSLDPAQGYAIKAITPYISTFFQVHGAEFTMWGVPADPRHDHLRWDPSSEEYGGSSNAAIRPILTTASDCGIDNGGLLFRADTWQRQEQFTATVEAPQRVNVEGCEDPRFRFEPDIRLQPTSRSAGSPTGLDVHLEVPQRDQAVADADELYAPNGDIQAIATPPMKKAVITFPEGMTISTSAAQGLGSCTSEQIGIGTNDPVECPENSRYGALTLHTPILPVDEPMVGDIFIARQNDNPFNNFLAMYFVIHDEDRGLLVKLPGKVELDPRTGQIKTTFDNLPQFPVSDMQLAFKGGVRAALVNPTTCGTKTIKAEFFSWHDPDTPVTSTSEYEVTQKPNGSPCVNHLAERPFDPQLSAGTLNPNAGSYSPFVFRLQRTDDDQEFSQLGTTLPPGLLANISGIAECSEAGIAQAEAKGRTGASEQLFPSCPASSFLGTTDVGSGVGQVITYIPGKAYLAGPYRGAPLSMVVITPILAGPYDLGVIAVRSAIHVKADTAQASVQTDPFPQIYEGIPVRLRDIRVKVDRPETTLNPTNCNPMAVTAHVTGTGGDLDSTADDTAVDLSERFQAANCASLGFKPSLKFRLKGGTKRGDFPALQAILKARPGDANIARSTVVLPRSEFIEQGHIRTVCTRVQFAADQCPAGSVYGTAKAKSPLFDEVLEGPVYLRSNGGERLLPDLVVSLNGKIEVALAGFIDSVKGRVRNTFDVVPDAPVTYFKLSMQGGKRGLLVNHLNLCEVTSRAEVRFVAQNGKVANSKPAMGTSCGKKAKKNRSSKR